MPAKKKTRANKPPEKAAESFVILLDGTEDTPESNSAVALAKHNTISDIANLHEQLMAALDSGEPITIDAGEVEIVDTAVVQLLSSFVRSAAAREIDVGWQGESHALADTVRRLGLESQLGLK